MRFKIGIAIFSIYIASFSGFLLELIGVKGMPLSIILLFLDSIVFYLGFSSILKSKSNLFFLLLILLISILNFLLHKYAIIGYFNGIREVLSIVLTFSFLESIRELKYKELLLKKMNRYMIIFLVCQIPVSFYQFYQYGAGDMVGGTLGEGFSGVLTLITIPMVFIRIKQRLNSIGFSAFYNIIFLIPLFLNETKISFILIPLMFLCLTNVKSIKKSLWSGVGAIFLFWSLNNLYSDMGNTRENPFKEMFNVEFLERYLFSEVEIGNDVPRFTKIIAAVGLLSKDPKDALVGIEVGIFKGGTTVGISALATQYDWLLLGSRPYSFYLLLVGGGALFILMLTFFIQKLFSDKTIGRSPQFILLLTGIFLIILFYNDAFRSVLFCYLYSYFVIYAKGGLQVSPKQT